MIVIGFNWVLPVNYSLPWHKIDEVRTGWELKEQATLIMFFLSESYSFSIYYNWWSSCQSLLTRHLLDKVLYKWNDLISFNSMAQRFFFFFASHELEKGENKNRICTFCLENIDWQSNTTNPTFILRNNQRNLHARGFEFYMRMQSSLD